LREIELNPENYKALNNLGFIYKREGKLPEAVFCFQRIIDLLPDDPRGYLMLASLYREMGREQEATKLLRILENQRRRVSSEG
jgi:tetratricopeptide (TPR) repeat protein